MAKKAAAALENFSENQLIYDEFNYYQDTKKVLGVHPVFKGLKLRELITKMNGLKAYKRASNLDHYIRRDSKKLSKIKDAESKAKFEARINDWKEELELINTIHKFND